MPLIVPFLVQLVNQTILILGARAPAASITTIAVTRELVVAFAIRKETSAGGSCDNEHVLDGRMISKIRDR